MIYLSYRFPDSFPHLRVCAFSHSHDELLRLFEAQKAELEKVKREKAQRKRTRFVLCFYSSLIRLGQLPR